MSFSELTNHQELEYIADSKNLNIIVYINMKLSFPEILDLFASGQSDKLDYPYVDIFFDDLRSYIDKKLTITPSYTENAISVAQLYKNLGIDVKHRKIYPDTLQYKYNVDLANYVKSLEPKSLKWNRIFYLHFWDSKSIRHFLHPLFNRNHTILKVFGHLNAFCKENRFALCPPINLKLTESMLSTDNHKAPISPQKFITSGSNFVLILSISSTENTLYIYLIFYGNKCIIIKPEKLYHINAYYILEIIGLPIELYNIYVYDFYKYYLGTNINRYYGVDDNLICGSWLSNITIKYCKQNYNYDPFPLVYYQKQIKKQIKYEPFNDIRYTTWNIDTYYNDIVNYDIDDIKYASEPYIAGSYFIFNYTEELYRQEPYPPQSTTLGKRKIDDTEGVSKRKNDIEEYSLSDISQIYSFNSPKYTHTRDIIFYNDPHALQYKTYLEKYNYITNKIYQPHTINTNINFYNPVNADKFLTNLLSNDIDINYYYNNNPIKLIEDVCNGTSDNYLFTDIKLSLIEGAIRNFSIYPTTINTGLLLFMKNQNINTPNITDVHQNIIQCLTTLSKINLNYYRIIVILSSYYDNSFNKMLVENSKLFSNDEFTKILENRVEKLSNKVIFLYQTEYFNKNIIKYNNPTGKFLPSSTLGYCTAIIKYCNYLALTYKNNCYGTIFIKFDPNYTSLIFKTVNRNNITNCILDTTIKYLVVYCVVYYKNEYDLGHANIILINKITKDILWFEPHGYSQREYVLRRNASEIFRMLGIPIEIYEWNITWMTDIISSFNGPQALEWYVYKNERKYTIYTGFCMYWCMFIAEYYISKWVSNNENQPIKKFIDDIMNYIIKNSKYNMKGIVAVNPTFLISEYTLNIIEKIHLYECIKEYDNTSKKYIGYYFTYDVNESSSLYKNILNTVNLITNSLFSLTSDNETQIYNSEIKLFHNGKEVNTTDTYEDKLKIILSNKNKFLNFKTV